jgi:hypothetical protein
MQISNKWTESRALHHLIYKTQDKQQEKKKSGRGAGYEEHKQTTIKAKI